MTENKRLYDIINKAEPRGQSVTYEGIPCTARTCVTQLNRLTEENELLKEEKELLKNKLDRIEDILPHFLSCAEISEFRGKTVKEDLALMKCWNKRYQK